MERTENIAYETLIEDYKYLFHLQEKMNNYLKEDIKSGHAILARFRAENERLSHIISRCIADLEDMLKEI